MPRKTPADYHTLAQKCGFRWSGPEVTNVKTRTGWECGQGHHWQARYSQIHQGSGCRVCTIQRLTLTFADYRALAQQRGFRWLGPEVSNTQTKTGWQCGQGHHWRTTYSSLQQGSGCPVCAREARGRLRPGSQ